MNAVPFDTLKMARKLEAAGFPGAQAAGAAEAMAEAMAGAELATKADVLGVKSDLQTVKTDLERTMLQTRHDLEHAIGKTRQDLEHAIGKTRQDLENKIDRVESKLESKIELLRRDMTIRLGAMLIASTSIILTAIRFLPLRP